MRVDSLLILGESLFRPGLGVDEALHNSARLGFDAVIAAPARPREYVLRLANDRLAEAADGRPVLHRLARVDPNQYDAVAELERCVEVLGCVGVYLNPDEEVFRAQDAIEVVRAARDLDVPVVIGAGVPGRSEPLQVLDLARRVPDATIIMTDGGQINISGLSMVDAWLALELHERLLVLSNGEYRQDHLERIARELGPERLLLASAAPYYEQAYEALRVANARFDPVQRELVEGLNAQRIFGLGERPPSVRAG